MAEQQLIICFTDEDKFYNKGISDYDFHQRHWFTQKN